MIVWGGYDNSEELWSLDLDEGSWTRLQPLGEIPVGRGDVEGVYDPIEHRLVFVGGTRFDTDGERLFSDVWELALDGPVTWRRLDIVGPPPLPRFEPGVVYDPKRHRLLMQGGHFSNVGPTDETWALSLDRPMSWTRIVASGESPPVRYGQVAVYDSRRDRLVVHGGVSYPGPDPDIWFLPLGNPNPSWSRLVIPGPSRIGREEAVAAYDSVADRLLVMGGIAGVYQDSLDVWEVKLDGSAPWQPVLVDGEVPHQQIDATLVRDPSHPRLILYGGLIAGGSTSEAWEFPLEGNPRWRRIAPTFDVPPAMWRPSLVYDSRGDRAILCGVPLFYDDSLKVFALPLDGGVRWQRVRPAGAAPRPRAGASMIFDPVGNRMVLYGGVADFEPGLPRLLGDLWELSLDGEPAWKQLRPTNPLPSGRVGHSAVYDPLRDRMLVFGGYGADTGTPSDLRNTTIALSLRGPLTWTEIRAKGDYPEPRIDQAMIYDSRRDRLVVYAGDTHERLHDIWTLDLGREPTWHELLPRGERPRGRDSFAATYDSLGDRMVIHGGFVTEGPTWTFGADFWAFSLSDERWDELLPTGTTVLGREYASALYDPGRDRMLIFGGQVWFDYTPELWELAWNRARRSHVTVLPRESVTSGATLSVATTISPSSHAPTIWLTLADSSPATVEIFSVTGRCMGRREVGFLGAGSHRYELSTMGLPAGLYLLRVIQAGRSARGKLVVF